MRENLGVKAPLRATRQHSSMQMVQVTVSTAAGIVRAVGLARE